MLYRIIFLSVVWFALGHTAYAQGFAFGAKGGLTVGIQQWESFQRDPLLRYHGDLFVESLTEYLGI